MNERHHPVGQGTGGDGGLGSGSVLFGGGAAVRESDPQRQGTGPAGGNGTMFGGTGGSGGTGAGTDPHVTSEG